MDTHLNELRNRLLSTDAEYARLSHEHTEHEHRLDELLAKPHLTESEQLEEVKLKKHKLFLKDQMEKILLSHRGSLAV
jgi:uncharacterized protein YdcH (DUF465 family)